VLEKVQMKSACPQGGYDAFDELRQTADGQGRQLPLAEHDLRFSLIVARTMAVGQAHSVRAVTDLLWKLECRINRQLPRISNAVLRGVDFTARGRSVALLGRGAEPRTPAPELAIVITTHARADACLGLLETLEEAVREAGLERRAFVIVLEDASDHDYSAVLELLERSFAGCFTFYRSSVWLGKRGRWLVYQQALDALRALQPSQVLFLEDDVRVTRTLVSSALARWQAIDDPAKAVLYLCRFDDDEIEGRWIRFRRVARHEARVSLTQWFDLHAFLAGGRFLDSLRYEMFPPWPSRWEGDPSRSSGVSEQFTLRLYGRGNVYQVDESLAFHGRMPSLLNVDARRARPLDNYSQSPLADVPQEPSHPKAG